MRLDFVDRGEEPNPLRAIAGKLSGDRACHDFNDAHRVAGGYERPYGFKKVTQRLAVRRKAEQPGEEELLRASAIANGDIRDAVCYEVCVAVESAIVLGLLCRYREDGIGGGRDPAFKRSHPASLDTVVTTANISCRGFGEPLENERLDVECIEDHRPAAPRGKNVCRNIELRTLNYSYTLACGDRSNRAPHPRG